MGERPAADRRRPGPVGDRPRHVARPASSTIRPSRSDSPRVGGQLRLDADHPRARAQRPDRDRDAARQPAAADRDEDRRDVRQVLGDLQPDRALAGDDPVVVERRDDRQAALGGDPLGDALALLARRPDDDDLGAVGLDPGLLQRGRVGRHDDDGRAPSSRAARATPWAWLPDE